MAIIDKTFYEIKSDPEGADKYGVPYSEIGNGEFAYRMWEVQKEKADSLQNTLPMGMWADEVGLNNKDFKEMVEFSTSAGYDPTDRTISDSFEPENSEQRLTTQGFTYGFGDEIAGAVGAIGDVITGKTEDSSFGQLYTQYRDSERQKMREYRKNFPEKALAYEIGGAIVSPGGFLKVPKLLKNASALKKAAVLSGTAGTIYGAGASEKETALEVAGDAALTGVGSSLFGVGFQKAIPMFGKIGEQTRKWMKKSEDTPRLDILRIAKNKAYEMADKSPARFGVKEFSQLEKNAKKIAQASNYEDFQKMLLKAL